MSLVLTSSNHDVSVEISIRNLNHEQTTCDTFWIIDRRAANTKTYECLSRNSFIIHDV